MALLGNGAQINTVTPEFIETHSLDVGLLIDLLGRWVVCAGLGNTLPWPIGCIMIQVQVDGVEGYDEDQIALIVPDFSNFMAWVPVIFGTPRLHCECDERDWDRHTGDAMSGSMPVQPLFWQSDEQLPPYTVTRSPLEYLTPQNMMG